MSFRWRADGGPLSFDENVQCNTIEGYRVGCDHSLDHYSVHDHPQN